MYGRGPMMGGHRGPMGGPMHHRPMGFFPMGGLFILPALMFGGWIVVAVLGGLLSLAGMVIGGIFEGLDALAEGAFSGGGIVIGVVIGLVVFYCFRNRKRKEAARRENIGTVDGVEVEQVIEPEKVYRTNY